MNEHVTLTVPALQAYVLVIRTALGGLALVNDLDMDTLEDLRQAADEACDYLMHQGAPAWQPAPGRMERRRQAARDLAGRA